MRGPAAASGIGRPDYPEAGGAGRFPKRSSPCCFRYLAHRLSASPTSSGDAAPPPALGVRRQDLVQGAGGLGAEPSAQPLPAGLVELQQRSREDALLLLVRQALRQQRDEPLLLRSARASIIVGCVPHDPPAGRRAPDDGESNGGEAPAVLGPPAELAPASVLMRPPPPVPLPGGSTRAPPPFHPPGAPPAGGTAAPVGGGAVVSAGHVGHTVIVWPSG